MAHLYDPFRVSCLIDDIDGDSWEKLIFDQSDFSIDLQEVE